MDFNHESQETHGSAFCRERAFPCFRFGKFERCGEVKESQPSQSDTNSERIVITAYGYPKL